MLIDLADFEPLFFKEPYNEWQNFIDWTVLNTGEDELVGMVFDGRVADVVFDIIDNGPTGSEVTPGSERGRIITGDAGADDLDVFALYSNIVALKEGGIYTTYGDLYGTLTLTFDNNGFGLLQDEFFRFSMDLDNVNTSVPEPATMLLMGVGLAGLVGSRLRRKNK